MSMILMISRLELLLLYLIAILFFYRLSQLKIGLALKNMRPFLWLFLVTFFLHALFTKGKILVQISQSSVALTREGMIKGAFYTLRIGILIVLANILTLTTSPMSLTDAFERFLTPFKRIGIPAHEIAMMLSISLRFIPILLSEVERIRKAQISRGCRFDGNIIEKIRSIVPLIVPLFLSTFRRANDLALAMDARCYRGSVERTSYEVLRFRRADLLALSFVLISCFPVFLLR